MTIFAPTKTLSQVTVPPAAMAGMARQKTIAVTRTPSRNDLHFFMFLSSCFFSFFYLQYRFLWSDFTIF